MSIAVAEDQEIRIAQESGDGEIFLELWGEYIDTQIEMGSYTIKTDKTMNYFEDLFHSYIDGSLDGVTIFGADNNAVLMWGETGSDLPYDTSLGKWASGWGTYIRPDYRRMGWSGLMREEGKKTLHGQGFDTLVGGVFSKNEIGLKANEKAFADNIKSHHKTFIVELGGHE